MAKGEKPAISRDYRKSQKRKGGLKTRIGFKGELPCVLVYSARPHVDYINPILSSIERKLRQKGFETQLLGTEIKSGEDYLEKLEQLIQGCVLGVIVLDGLRPNVLFEFGFLMGKKKPIILLQSKEGCINIKTLFKSFQESGLSEGSFKNKLKNPSIDISCHLSDFAGKHIEYFDWRASEADPTSTLNILKKQLKKNEKQIIEEAKNVKTKSIPTAYLQNFFQPLKNIIEYYYTDASEFDVSDLKEAHKQIESIAQEQKVKVPYELSTMIAAAYTSKTEEMELEVGEIINCLCSALSIYKEILSSISIYNEPILYADTHRKMGDVYLELSVYEDRKENCENVINKYREALKVFTRNKYPMDYAVTQNNLGDAYGRLSDLIGNASNCKKGIKACEEAIKISNYYSFPLNYAEAQNNLGLLYTTLANIESKASYCKKAIKAYNRAFKVYTINFFPLEYAASNINLGNAYTTLAELEAKAPNSKRAIKAFKEALKVYNLERSPMDYAVNQTNIGIAYSILAEVNDKVSNCKKAIKAYKKALKVFTFDRVPIDYATTQCNLGFTYGTLADAESKASNCKKAIAACKEALRVFNYDLFPVDYAVTQHNLGIAYGLLAEVELKASNCKKASEAYAETLKVYTKREFPRYYQEVKENLQNLLNFTKTNKSC